MWMDGWAGQDIFDLPARQSIVFLMGLTGGLLLYSPGGCLIAGSGFACLSGGQAEHHLSQRGGVAG